MTRVKVNGTEREIDAGRVPDTRQNLELTSQAWYLAGEQARAIPPLLIYVTGRRTVPGAIGRRLASTVESAGGSAKFVRAADKTHASISGDIGAPDDRVTREILGFLEQATAAPKPASD